MDDDKINIWVSLANIKQIPVSVSKADEQEYRNAEKLVNALWNKWMPLFRNTASQEEVMARVAFQFARLYIHAHEQNVAVGAELKEFERKLDEIVVKM